MTAPVLATDPEAIRALTAPFIRRAEGLRLHAYADPATHGPPWTVGYGATGPDIGVETVWTQAEAEADLAKRLDEALMEVGSLITASIGNESYAALISIEYNMGPGNLRKSSLLRDVNAGNFQKAAADFGLYVKANGHVFEPLVTRRARESALFLQGVGIPVPTSTAA